MSSYVNINPNPKKKNVGDCVVRAICLAEDMEWDQVYLDLCIQGYTMADMPSSNDVWSAYIASKGWGYHRLQDSCPFCYTIDDFAREHNHGTYIVATGTHVVCVKDGSILDNWDSSEKTPLFYFSKEK